MATVSIVSVLVTFLLVAAFFSLTAHVAARYLLGNVAISHALAVGPALAAVSFVGTALEVHPVLVLAVAALVDATAIRLSYGRRLPTTLLLAFFHAVVSVIAGAVLFALFLLAASAPG